MRDVDDDAAFDFEGAAEGGDERPEEARVATRKAGPGGRPRISVILPALNEAPNLPHVLARMPRCVDEIVLIDGHSADDTIRVAQMARPDIRVVMQRGTGKGNALACGFAASLGDIIVMLDADGSTDPAEIPRFVEALRAGADFAKGSRFIEGGGSVDITPLRRAGNRVLCTIVNVLFRTSYTDLCYGYNAFWRGCLPHMGVVCDGFEVETYINVRVARSRLRIAEVPSYEHERLYGVSHLKPFRDGLRVIRTILRERFSPRNHGAKARSRPLEFDELPLPREVVLPEPVQAF